MVKHTKIIVFVVSMFIVFFTYNKFIKQNSKIIYIPLGDSIAEGMTPYHSIDYGYTDYIKDYLSDNNKLSFYTKKYTKSGYTIEDIKNDINNNKTIVEDNKTYYLKEILRESDLVTVTVGANDLMKGMSLDDIPVKLLNIKSIKKDIDDVMKSYKDLLKLIKQYAKEEIIVTGYFNPLPKMTQYKEEIDEIVKYFNYSIEEMCNDFDVKYVDLFDSLNNKKDIFPNPLDIHPSKIGYEIISKEIIKNIES